jgi:crossover junction endodeoxyribonuclease RuvC
VSDYGASTKEQMQQMVKLLLGLEELPEPHDAADALAVAICHLREAKLRELIEQSQG